MDLSTPVSKVTGIGPAYAARLEKLGILTVEDFIYYAPFRYEDLSARSSVSSLEAGEVVTVTGMIMEIRTVYTRTGKSLQKAIFSDGTGNLNVTWFNQPYLEKTFKRHPHVALSGKISIFNRQPTLTSPQHELIHNNLTNTIHTGRLVSMYHVTSGLSSKWLRSRLAVLLKNLTLHDPLGDSAKKHGLIDLASALKLLHFPQSTQDYQKARARLAYDEFFLLQLASEWRKAAWNQQALSYQFSIKSADLKAFTDKLPFSLTKAQVKSLKEVIEDLNAPKPMNRLLQGDVGSGKTVIAAAAMYATAKQKLLSVLMAPTEILALQHAKTIEALVTPLGLSVSVQTNSRKDPLDNCHIIIGTHALLFRELPQNIGLIVIDEQHRFGVKQRMQLLEQPTIPHVLSMTATPIPRTIALSLYAELDISVIDEMPVGRKPVKTWVVPEQKRRGAYSWIRDQVSQHGSQVFVICPFVEESENEQLDEVKAVESEFEHLKSVLSPLRVCMLHGRMKAKEKSKIMNQFKQKDYDVMLATPVIEVGIDIPNATIIMIESAERFGLAGLHQLRGRVGRGESQSYCLLFTSHNNEVDRLKHLERTSSGFALAQLDLEIRGPGDLYGTKQSGYINLKFASLTDSDLILLTHKEAKALVAVHGIDQIDPALLGKLKTILANQTSPH